MDREQDEFDKTFSWTGPDLRSVLEDTWKEEMLVAITGEVVNQSAEEWDLGFRFLVTFPMRKRAIFCLLLELKQKFYDI